MLFPTRAAAATSRPSRLTDYHSLPLLQSHPRFCQLRQFIYLSEIEDSAINFHLRAHTFRRRYCFIRRCRVEKINFPSPALEWSKCTLCFPSVVSPSQMCRRKPRGRYCGYVTISMTKQELPNDSVCSFRVETRHSSHQHEAHATAD